MRIVTTRGKSKMEIKVVSEFSSLLVETQLETATKVSFKTTNTMEEESITGPEETDMKESG